MPPVPIVFMFAKQPASLEKICARIQELTGNPVRSIPPSSGSSLQYRKGCIAFDAVPEQQLAIWEFPPDYRKPKPGEADVNHDDALYVPYEIHRWIEDPTDQWTVVFFNSEIPNERLVNAARVALEDLGGQADVPIENSVREHVSRPQSRSALRRKYHFAKFGTYAGFTVAGFFALFYFFGLLIALLPLFVVTFVALSLMHLKNAVRSSG